MFWAPLHTTQRMREAEAFMKVKEMLTDEMGPSAGVSDGEVLKSASIETYL